MGNADLILIADMDVSRINAKLNGIATNTSKQAGQAGRSFSKMSKSQRQEVRQLGFALQRMGIQGTAAFGEMFVAAGLAGVGIGLVVIAVVKLVGTIKSIVTAAVNAFKKVTALGVETAKEYELAGAQFKAVMLGNEKAAEATLNRIKKLSREVGQNLVGVARAFLPEVESLDQLEDILKIATALAQYQPEQGILGARIALQEFLSGETRSLRRRFEIPQADIDKMKEAFETGGIQAAINELNMFLERTGRSLEDLSDTATVAFNRMREGWRQLAAVYGEPIVAAAKDEVNELNSVLDNLRPILEAVAGSFGNVVAKVVELVGSNLQDFVENINFGNLFAIGEAFGGVVDAFGMFLDFLTPGTTLAEQFDTATYSLIGTLLTLQKTFLDLAFKVAGARLEIALFAQDMANLSKFAGIGEVLTETLGNKFSLTHEIFGFIAGVSGGISVMAGTILDAEGDVKSLGIAMAEWHRDWALFEQDLYGIAELDFGDDSGEDEANFIQQRKKFKDELDVLLSDLEATQEEYNEIIAKFDDKAFAKFAAIQTRYDRRLEEIDKRAGRKFAELELKKLEKLDDLRTSYNAKFEKGALDLTRKEEDIARRHGRRVLQIEEDLSTDRLDAQEEYLRRLDEINRRFDFDAQEAIRANDAIAYLRIQRRRKFELNEAKIGRDEDIEDAADKADRRREELKDTLDQEIEDAQIANTRKLEDLNTWLNAQTAAIDLWSEREEAKRVKRHADERGDAFRAKELQLEDYRLWWVALDIETEKGAASIVAQMAQMVRDIQEIFRKMPSMQGMFGAQARALGIPYQYGTARGLRIQQRGGAGYGLAPGTQPGGQQYQSQLTSARQEAFNLGLQLGNTPAELNAILQSTDLKGLQDLIRKWKQQVNQQVPAPGGRDTGYDVGTGLLPGEEQPPLSEGQRNLAETLAFTLGNQLGFDNSYIDGIISGLTIEELHKIIQTWQAQVDANAARGFQHGGFIRRGITARVNEPYDGDRENPELYLPKDDLVGTGGGMRLPQITKDGSGAGSGAGSRTGSGKGFDPSTFLPRAESADPMLLGGSLRYGKIKTQLFTPLADGYIVPIQQLARLTGKPGLDIMTTIQEIIGAGGKGRSTKILEQLGIKGRAFGGPVKAGMPVVVGEPLAGQKVNPEVFLPSINSISGIKEILREVGKATKKPIGKIRRIEEIKGLPLPGGGPTRRPTETIGGGPTRRPTETIGGGPTRLPTETTGGRSATGKGFYDPILDRRGAPGTSAFESASLALRQMYFSPPFIAGSRGGNTYDNRRTVEVVNPEVNPTLSQIEIAQIKKIYAELRLEETLV